MMDESPFAPGAPRFPSGPDPPGHVLTGIVESEIQRVTPRLLPLGQSAPWPEPRPRSAVPSKPHAPPASTSPMRGRRRPATSTPHGPVRWPRPWPLGARHTTRRRRVPPNERCRPCAAGRRHEQVQGHGRPAQVQDSYATSAQLGRHDVCARPRGDLSLRELRGAPWRASRAAVRAVARGPLAHLTAAAVVRTSARVRAASA